MKRKLADSRGALKLDFEAKISLINQVTKLTAELATSETDIEDLKVRCNDLEKREEERLAKISQGQERILEITQERDNAIVERDEVISQTNKVEQELVDLKDYILGVH